MKERWKSAASAVAATAAIVLGFGGAAQASERDSEVVFAATVPMNIIGYNEEVAEANGFRLVEVDGETISIPVSEEARAIVSDAAVLGQAHARGEVFGDCGSSYVYGSRTIFQTVLIDTGYQINLPSVYHNWNVAVTTSAGFLHDQNFSGLNFSNQWGDSQYTPNLGSSVLGGGIVSVTLGSYAQRIDGAICYSGNPNDGF